MRRSAAVNPPLLLVAHGTRAAEGPQVIEALAAATATRSGAPVDIGYVDVIGPTVAEALARIPGPVVVVPTFLTSGYHVRTDLPEQVASTGRADIAITDPLGPAPEITDALVDRLRDAGWCPGRRVLLSAAGSSDDRALSDVRAAARHLGRRCGQWLDPSYITTAGPATEQVCRADEFIAPYLLAPGLFHRTLAQLPVAGVADPIGAHPAVVDLIARRYRRAVRDDLSAA